MDIWISYAAFDIGFPGKKLNVIHQSSIQVIQMSVGFRNVKLGNSNVQ